MITATMTTLTGRLSGQFGGAWSKATSASASTSAVGGFIQPRRNVQHNHRLDPIQEELMNEACIVVDGNDRAIGQASKRDCHIFDEANPKGILHRAFSVFLFNSKNELLMQKRAPTKITFPGHFTNTCCSHPLHFADELEETDILGVRRAAQRKLEHELGIAREQMPLDGFHYLTRIHYCSLFAAGWGEHEIDYILFAKRNVETKPNPEEVEEVRYIARADFDAFLASLVKQGIPMTPWFNIIVQNFLYKWWDNIENLDQFSEQRKRIYRL